MYLLLIKAKMLRRNKLKERNSIFKLILKKNKVFLKNKISNFFKKKIIINNKITNNRRKFYLKIKHFFIEILKKKK
jgi:hypothetical protein